MKRLLLIVICSLPCVIGAFPAYVPWGGMLLVLLEQNRAEKKRLAHAKRTTLLEKIDTAKLPDGKNKKSNRINVRNLIKRNPTTITEDSLL